MQFQRMPKPPGWQEQQAVEIRRDWITYLAKGMGIDTDVHKGHELETLVVRKMLEQAVRWREKGGVLEFVGLRLEEALRVSGSGSSGSGSGL